MQKISFNLSGLMRLLFKSFIEELNTAVQYGLNPQDYHSIILFKQSSTSLNMSCYALMRCYLISVISLVESSPKH
jgi:hypothetical protein